MKTSNLIACSQVPVRIDARLIIVELTNLIFDNVQKPLFYTLSIDQDLGLGIIALARKGIQIWNFPSSGTVPCQEKLSHFSSEPDPWNRDPGSHCRISLIEAEKGLDHETVLLSGLQSLTSPKRGCDMSEKAPGLATQEWLSRNACRNGMTASRILFSGNR